MKFCVMLLPLLLLSLAWAWDEEFCGRSRYPDAGAEIPVFDQYIVGGWPARVHEFPWMVSLKNRGGLHFCGGNIITSRHILTAAHCTDDGLEASDVQVVIAEHIRVGEDPENDYKQTVNVSEIISHPDFDASTFENDVALLVLEEALDFSVSEQAFLPICKPDPFFNGTTLNGALVTASGWGATQNDNTLLANELRYTNLRVTTNEICQECPLMPQDYIYDDMICAGVCGTDNIRDACWGDSGGPLALVNPESGRWEVVGLTSWGFSCAGRTPGVYALVPYHLDWIEENIGDTA